MLVLRTKSLCELPAALPHLRAGLLSAPYRWGNMPLMPKNEQSKDVISGPPELKSEVSQEIIIQSDGTVEIPWFLPKASDLVLAVWKQTTGDPFPVRVNSGQLYCG